MRFWRRSAKAADCPRVTHAVRVGPEQMVIHLPGVPKRPYTALSPDFTVRVARTEKGKLAITVTPKVDTDKMAKAVADWAGYRCRVWWDADREPVCELTAGHIGPHWDGRCWFGDDRHEVKPPAVSA